MGQNNDIIMGSENECTTDLSFPGLGDKSSPKNMFGASTQGGTRLEL